MLRLSTTLPRAARRELRHPAEMPWLVFGIAATLVVGTTSTLLLWAGVETDGTLEQIVAITLLSPIALLLMRGYLYGQQRASGVRLSPTQFPDAYRMVAEAAAVAGLRRMPDAYVVSGSGVVNAFAAGHGHRRFVVLHSDLFEIGGRTRDPDALRFVIGHEVGHLAAGHVAYWRLVATVLFRPVPVLGSALSRAQEYTADNYGFAVAPQGAAGAISTLAAGKYLNREVRPDEYADRAVVDRSIFIWVTNLLSSHPILPWRGHALRHRDRAGRMFFAPRHGVVGSASLPAASTRTRTWADPQQAMAFLAAYQQPGEDVFGGVQIAHRAARIEPTPVLDGGPEGPAVSTPLPAPAGLPGSGLPHGTTAADARHPDRLDPGADAARGDARDPSGGDLRDNSGGHARDNSGGDARDPSGGDRDNRPRDSGDDQGPEDGTQPPRA